MKEFSIMLGVLLVWIALNRWVLPWFGVQTCMSGACQTGYSSSPAPPSCCPSPVAEPGSQDQKDSLTPEGAGK